MSNYLSFDVSSVPRDWLVIPCGVFFKEKSIKNTEGEMNLSVYRDYGVIPKDSRDDNHNRVSEDTSNYKLVEPGDFVLNKMKGWSGSLGVSDYRGIVSPSYTVLEPVREIHNKYFHYLLRSETYRQMYESLSYGVRIGQWELRYHDFKQIPSLYPPIEEQKLISRYLNKKTNQIDSLVEKIQKKIKLLKKQRTSLINHYVTKGLDPHVEMKDSGVEWIGQIPKHWSVKTLKRIGKRKSGDGFKIDLQGREDGQVPFYKVSDTNHVGNEIFLTISNNYLNEEEVKNNKLRKFPSNTIIFPKIGEVLKLNKRRISIKECCIDNNMMGFLPFSEDLTKFIYFFMTLVNFEWYCSDGTIPSISETQVGNIPFISPPKEEQNHIVSKIEQDVERLDRLVLLEQQRTNKLSEYRQSLISSVVTGKVRITEDMV